MLVAASVAPATAQGPRGAGPDARTTAAGTIRIGFGAQWERNAEAYFGRRVRELGAPFTLDTLGGATIPGLGAAEDAAKIAAGLPGLAATLGASRVHVRTERDATPIFADVGITSRLSVGIAVPLVTASLRTDAAVNAAGPPANFGLNPALSSAAVAGNTAALATQLSAAGNYVAGQVASCAAAPGAPGCAPYLASSGAASQLVSSAAAYQSAIATLYGTARGSGMPYVPLATSAVQYAVAARLAGLKAAFAAFGAPAITAAAPAGAPAPITGSDFQRILTDSAFSIASTGIVPVVRRGTGNIELSAQFVLHDSYGSGDDGAATRGAIWWRAALGGAYLAATVKESSVADLIPVDVGDPFATYVARGIGEIGVGQETALAGSISVAVHGASSAATRVPAAGSGPFSRTAALPVTRGEEFVVTLAPRWSPSEAIAVAGTYSYRFKAADRYPEMVWIGPGPIPHGPKPGADSEQREHRFGASIAYSTVASWQAGGARWPIEVVLTHFQTTAGSGGVVPKLAYDDVTVRWYWRPFGRERRATAR